MVDSEQPSDTPADIRATQDLGEILRKARVAQDLTIEQLATELRIEARQLSALEENRFEQIGVPVFIKGYLRQYGQRLGVDCSELLALYYKQAKHEEIDIRPSRTIKLRDERQIMGWVVAVVVLLVIVAGLAVWSLDGGEFDFAAAAGSALRPSGSVVPAARVDSVAATSRPAAAPPAAAPAIAPADSPAITLAPEPDRVAALPPANSAPLLDTPEVAPAEDVNGDTPADLTPLDLTFDAESWAEITDGRGERLFFGLGAPGRHAVVRGEPPFAVVLGNAEAVRLLVNGESYAIPTRGRVGNLARFSIDTVEE